jgi:hypothetical protein
MHKYDQPEQKKKVMSDNDQADFVMQVTLNHGKKQQVNFQVSLRTAATTNLGLTEIIWHVKPVARTSIPLPAFFFPSTLNSTKPVARELR